jgi:dihydrofolate synthase/folylpolyglutamate synthase
LSASLTYSEAVAHLRGAKRFGIHPSLDGIRALTHELGEPQRGFDAIQVAGTNGKGSTARMIAAVLHAAGRRVGLFTSPNLYDYEEQFELDGRQVTPEEFAAAVSVVADAAAAARVQLSQDLTEFELATGIALQLFSAVEVDVAVLEVGLGGRWDATSVVTPRVAVLTTLGHDHAAQLGPGLASIAAEKAAIVPNGGVVVIGPGFSAGEEIALANARERGARAVRVAIGTGEPDAGRALLREQAGGRFEVATVRATYRDLEVPGAPYQRVNASAAIVAAEEFVEAALDLEALRGVLEGFSVPARFEGFDARVPVIVDGAHNDDAARALAAAIAERFGEARPTLVLGMLADKDPATVLAELGPVVGDVIVAAPDSPRALSAAELHEVCTASLGTERCDREGSVSAALDRALETAAGGVVVAGSLVTAAEARAHLIAQGRGRIRLGRDG